MNDKILVLINSIRRDMAAIATIYDELARHPLPADTDGDRLIVIGYHLHKGGNCGDGWGVARAQSDCW